MQDAGSMLSPYTWRIALIPLVGFLALALDDFRGRFLFGTDALAPKDRTAYFDTYNKDAPLWPLF